MITINTLQNKIKNNRFQFAAALKAAGYVKKLIADNICNDSELLRLALDIYNDHWDAFDKEAFEDLVDSIKAA